MMIKFNKREAIVLITILFLLVVINIIGYCRREHWKKQYSLIIEELTCQISINSANQTELETLPGIGPALAQRIIDYRKEYGNFRSLDGLKCVRGIGEEKYRKILPYIKL
jgi:comEA protein